ncbi:MAG: 16S rRNA (cytosine(1402)-N(4))-methyltransferase RsmH [Acidimicrobiales bacterium]
MSGPPPEPLEPFEHRAVMVDEVTALLAEVPAGPVVDATVGGGGHARALLEVHPGVEVVGLDRDPAALAAAQRILRPYGGRVRLRHARFDRIADVCEELGHEHLSGALFDLGVSSAQLEHAARGFSYHADGPLDMRMDPDEPMTAADVVNGYSEQRLCEVLVHGGDERFAGRIARAIVAARPLHTTAELARVVSDAIPAPARRRPGHPARRSFQAIRIEVNDELGILRGALDTAVDLLAPGGRIVVLAYHSGEDRIVKVCFAAAATGGCVCPPRLPCVCGARPRVRHLCRGTRPRTAEVAANRRAQSARLRAIEKLAAGVSS